MANTGTWSVVLDQQLGAAAAAISRELSAAIAEAGGTLIESAPASTHIAVRLAPPPLPAESYHIASRPDAGALRIICEGADRRGALYAAYDLAARIRHQEPLDSLDLRETPHCTFRELMAASCDHEFYRRVIRHMPRWRLNTFLLFSAFNRPHHIPAWSQSFFSTYESIPITYRNYPEIAAKVEASSEYQQVREDFPRLLRYAKGHEIDIALKFLVLHYTRFDAEGGHYTLDYQRRRQIMREDLPHLFPNGRKTPDFDSDAPYAFVREQLEELFELYPDLAGISVEPEEMATFPLSYMQSGGYGMTSLFTVEQRRRWIPRMVDVVEEVCARYGRFCFWDLHGGGDTTIEALLAAAKTRPGGLRLRAESTQAEQVFSDNYPSCHFDKVAEAGDGMCDHDVHMENLCEFPWLPVVLDRYIVRHTQAGLAAGLRGGGVMWCLHRPYYSPLNDWSDINMELNTRLLWDPNEPVDSIWERWLRRTFDAGAPVAGHLLRRTQEVFNGIAYFNNTNALGWFQHSGFPTSLNAAWLWGEGFQPAGTPLYAMGWCGAAKERAVSMAQMRAEKQAAVRQAQSLLEYLADHRSELRDCDYRAFLPRYLALSYAARYSAALTEAMWSFTNLHLRAYDPDCIKPRAGLEQALDAMAAIHAEMLDDDRLHLLEADVYYGGLKTRFHDTIPSLIKDFRFHDRVLSSPPASDAALSEPERKWAQRVRRWVAEQREKFERNARGVDAEEVWAVSMGDRDAPSNQHNGLDRSHRND